jgi:flagellar hook-length control protein FliK
VSLSVLSGARDTAGQIVSGAETATAAATAEGAAPAEGFDALMNSLLGTMAPETAVTAAGLKTFPKSPAASSAEAAPAADTATVDTGLLALISGGAVPMSETLPADGKGLPPATAVTADGAAKVAAADDTELDDGDSEPLLAMLMQDGPVPQPSAMTADTPAPAADGGTATIPADTAATPAASIAADVTAMIPDTIPAAAPPQAVSTPVSSSDPSSTVATSSTPSSTAAAVPPPVSATTAASTAAAPAMEAAVSDKTMEGHARTEQVPPQSVRPDTSVPGTTDNGTTARDGSSQNGNPQGGQTPLQEILAKIGGADGAARGGGDSFRTLLQGADNGTTANTGALVYTQPGAAAGTARDTAVPSLPVHTPLRHPEWSDEVSQRVRWVLGNQVQSAELKINPPQLGPIEVRVSVDSDQQMTVTLSSQHALVRETLQDSVPRLRDLMSEHGFNAVNVDVSQHSSSDGRKPAAQMNADPAMRSETDAMDTSQDTTTILQRDMRGLVDYYA